MLGVFIGEMEWLQAVLLQLILLSFGRLKDFLPKEYIKQKGERKIFMVRAGRSGDSLGRL